MPITGKFVADFASFQDAVQKATVSLKGMETQGNTVSNSLNRMVDQFSGRKIIQDAELMSQAFTQLAEKGIGLTNKELTRMGEVANEAIAKLRAGGEAVPPGMQRIADAAAKIRGPLDQASSAGASLFTSLKNVAGVLGVAFSVGALTNFVGKVFSAASTIKDMSDQLGLSIEATQRFKFAAEQTGSTLDNVGTAIQFMNKTLAEGGGGTAQVLREAGLQFDAIRSMRPEDAFLAIADAIKEIPDPMEQARVQTELFGRGAATLLPGIKEGFRDVAAGASVMADDTVKELERAQDAWAGFFDWLTVKSASFIVVAQKAGTEAAKALSSGLASPSGTGGDVLGDFAKQAKDSALQAAMDKIVQAGGKVAQSWGQANTTLGVTVQTLEQLDAEEKEINRSIQRSTESIQAYGTMMDAAAAAGVKAFALHQKHLKDVADQTKAVNLQMGILVHDRLEALGSRGQTILRAMTDESVKFALAMTGNLPVVEGLGDKMQVLGEKSQTGIKPIMPLLNTFKLNLTDLSRSLTELATVAGGSFGTIARSLATMVTAAQTAKTSIDQIKQGASAGFSLDGILGMTSGISGLVSVALTAISAMKKLFSLGGPSEEQLAGREAIADFHAELEAMLSVAQRAEAGNEAWKIDVIAIRDAYIAAGKTVAEAEAATKKLWESAEGGSESARRAIEEIRKVIGKNTEATDEATAATEEQAQATIETATQAAKALDELGPRLKTNEGEWRSWGDVVTAEIQRIANAVRAMQIPTGGSMPSGGNGGFGPTGGVLERTGTANVTVNTVISGRTVATANAEAALGWAT